MPQPYVSQHNPYRTDYLYLSPTLRLEIKIVTVKRLFIQLFQLLCLRLLRVAYKPYTQISLLHDRRDYGVSEVCIQHHLLIPNSDSAMGINHCLYCSLDSHTTFTCGNRSAMAQVWGSTLSTTLVARCSTVAIHTYPYFVALT